MEEHYGYMIQFFGLRIPSDTRTTQLGGGRYTDSIVQPAWSYSLRRQLRPQQLRPAGGDPAPPGEPPRHGPSPAPCAGSSRHGVFAIRRTADFEQIILEESATDLSWFLDQALHTDRGLDYRVRRRQLTQGTRIPRLVLGGGRREDPARTSPIPGNAERRPTWKQREPTSNTRTRTKTKMRNDVPHRIVVERRGEFIHPVTVELVFEDGEIVRQEWDGRPDG